MRALVHQSFQPTSSGLACDGASVEAIVERVGTPVYIYSARAIREAYRAIDEAFDADPPDLAAVVRRSVAALREEEALR